MCRGVRRVEFAEEVERAEGGEGGMDTGLEGVGGGGMERVECVEGLEGAEGWRGGKGYRGAEVEWVARKVGGSFNDELTLKPNSRYIILGCNNIWNYQTIEIVDVTIQLYR